MSVYWNKYESCHQRIWFSSIQKVIMVVMPHLDQGCEYIKPKFARNHPLVCLTLIPGRGCTSDTHLCLYQHNFAIAYLKRWGDDWGHGQPLQFWIFFDRLKSNKLSAVWKVASCLRIRFEMLPNAELSMFVWLLQNSLEIHSWQRPLFFVYKRLFIFRNDCRHDSD